jgi:hypothetical protein
LHQLGDDRVGEITPAMSLVECGIDNRNPIHRPRCIQYFPRVGRQTVG